MHGRPSGEQAKSDEPYDAAASSTGRLSAEDARDEKLLHRRRSSGEHERPYEDGLLQRLDNSDSEDELDGGDGIPASPRSPARKEGEQEKRAPLMRRSSSARDRKSFFTEMASQTVPMLFLSLVGSILAGEVLARLKFWPVFIRVEELFILIPILLNLKGNIEMNLSSRFSTSANIGELDIRLTRQTLVIGNLALLQVQALIVSFVAGLVAFLLGLTSRIGFIESRTSADERGGYFECVMVLCASMLAASFSSAITGSSMCSLVVLSRRFKINPDNIATPLTASLGDLLTLTILGIISSFFLRFMSTLVSTFVFLGLLCAIGFHALVTIRNAYVQELLWAGWLPLAFALVVSSATGLVLADYIDAFRGFGLMAPVVTGLSGNVGAIFVSRISTALHSSRTENYKRTASTLFCISTPVLCLFLLFAWATGQVSVTPAFAVLYCGVSATIVALSLTIGFFLATTLWKFDYDPDINALPLLTSLTDVSGQLLLATAFALTHRELPPPELPSDMVANATATAITTAVNGTLTRLF